MRLKNFVTSFTMFALLGLASTCLASVEEEGLKLMQGTDCFTCHSVDQKVVGPAYKDVAKKYKGANAGTIAKLVKKVKDGGAGNWGAIPMAAHPQFSDADIEKMVRWVLSVKPGMKVGPASAASAPAPAAAPAEKPSTKAESKVESAAEPSHPTENFADEKVKDVTKLLDKYECFGCHFTGQEMPWPDLKQIASRYKNKPEVVAGLVKKVKKGGAGEWGKVPQVPYPNVTDATMERMIQWMLTNGASYTGSAAAETPSLDASKMSGEQLVKASDCLSCHSIENKVVGPAYKDVAKRYKGANAQVIATLVKKVKTGGSGNWGSIPMAAHPNLSDAALEKMVRWVLQQ